MGETGWGHGYWEEGTEDGGVEDEVNLILTSSHIG